VRTVGCAIALSCGFSNGGCVELLGIDDVTVEMDGDAGIRDGNTDEGGTCAEREWNAPLLIANVGSAHNEVRPTLTADESILLFTTDRDAPDTFEGSDIFVARRDSRLSAFNDPSHLAGLSTPDAYDAEAMITGDGLVVFAAQGHWNAPTGVDVHVSTRETSVTDFPETTSVANINSDIWDAAPFYCTVCGELWLFSNRRDGSGDHDLYRAAGSISSGFDAPTRVVELSTAERETSPVLSADGLTVFFASRRSDGGAAGADDIWFATREAFNAQFGDPQPVDSLNSPFDEHPGWLSPDGCRLYFDSNRSGNYELYVAERNR
jgi:hypothetical protein